MTQELILVVSKTGEVRSIYQEKLDLRLLGPAQITRASTVEPELDGTWTVDLGLSNGPRLAGYKKRSEALEAEKQWLLMNRF